MSRPTSLCMLFLLSACASTPRPTILTELDAIRNGRDTREARALVPQADARAEKLRNDAEAAWPKGQTATAEIMAERAIAAYSDARGLARIVKAEQRLLATKAEVHRAETLLQKVEADQRKAAAESADLDAQLRILREAEAIAETRASTPDREQARLAASRTALAQARLLCVSAKLIRATIPQAGSSSEIDVTLTELDALGTKLAAGGGKAPIPIRESIALRSRCQRYLTEVRRPARMENPVSERPDQLFVELTQAGFTPSRDDRGIVVTLHDVFKGSALDQKVIKKLDDLGHLAQRFEHTPLLVVAHSMKGEPNATDQQRGDTAGGRLRLSGVTHVQVQAVGGRLPIARTRDLSQMRLNERLEVVFVTPL